MDNYLFQAAPKPVQTRTTKKSIYRDDEQKESLDATSLRVGGTGANLMNDRRVSRGSTYAPSKRTQAFLPQANFRPLPMKQQGQQKATSAALAQAQTLARRTLLEKQQHPLPPTSAMTYEQQQSQHDPSSSTLFTNTSTIDFIRISTPEPVSGRVHCTIQTDTYLEDLRSSAQSKKMDFQTQTDAEQDRPTAPLFTPQSSGDDVSTFIEPNALFDYDLEVESILNVLLEKTLSQALMEVCEEEELDAIEQHKSAYQQDRSLALINVQQVVQRDERRKEERQRRKEQEGERKEQERLTKKKHSAALLAKMMTEKLEEEVLSKLQEKGYFDDPVRKEVESLYMPLLLQATASKLKKAEEVREVVEEMIHTQIKACRLSYEIAAKKEDEVLTTEYVKWMLSPQTVEQPIPSALAGARRYAWSDVDQGGEKIEDSTSSSSSTSTSSSSSSSNLPQSPYTLAVRIVTEILAERARQAESDRKRLHDIILIQALQRGRHDREKCAGMMKRAKKRREREAMDPDVLVKSLPVEVGFQVRVEEVNDASVAASSASAAPSRRFVICQLSSHSSGAQAGLVLGDIVLSINGAPLTSISSLFPSNLQEQLGLSVGDILTLSVLRDTTDKRTEDILVELACAEEEDSDSYTQEQVREMRLDAEMDVSESIWHTKETAQEALRKYAPKLGATVTDASNGVGVKVSKLSSDSIAAHCGLEEGDIIVKMNGEEVEDAKDVMQRCKEMMVGECVELEVIPASAASSDATKSPRPATVKKVIELGGGGKKMSREAIRGLRRIAGLEIYGEQ